MKRDRTTSTDVVIIGAGPAGCAAAIALQAADIRCTVFERQLSTTGHPGEPRESLHPGVRSLLAMLGAEVAWDQAATGKYMGIVRNGKYERLAPPEEADWHGGNVRRSIFDHVLQKHAMQGGAELLYGCAIRDLILIDDRVVGVRSGQGTEHYANFVIDASGRQQLAARRMAAKHRFASEPLVVSSGRTERSMHPPDTAHFSCRNDGWFWEAVDSDGSATWTRVTKPEAVERLRHDAGKNTILQRAGARWRLVLPVVADGLLLAGDAASVLDPASGQGVFKALSNGLLAANTVAGILRQGRPENVELALYDESIAADFEDRTEELAQAYNDLGVPLSVGHQLRAT